tara:strand:- start:976 stop:1305 length:330 start_codon:yes stop_codon:yes gene_type:complete
MELTGKCKEEFEKFYLKDIDIDECEFFNNDTILSIFYTEKESMQYGVYVDFFDSVGFNIVIEQLDYQSWYNYRITNLVLLQFKGTKLSCRPKTRLLAIEKANEIYNNAH